MNVSPRLRLTHIVVFSLVGLLILSGAILGRVGVSKAGEILEDHWRGAYDILVTHEDGFEMISPGRDAHGFSLVDNNYASSNTRVISDDQLAQIDALDSVELAAPAAFIGREANTVPWIYFAKVDHQFDEEPIQEYEIHWSITDDNGIIFERTNNIRIDATRWTGEDGWAHTVGISFVNDFAPPDRLKLLVQGLVYDGHLMLTWGQGPTIATTIAAVDPEREMELLGSSGSFLQPLADFDSWIAERGPLTVEEAFGEYGDQAPPELEGLPGLEPGTSPLPSYAHGGDSTIIGYVRNTDAYPSTVVSATVTGVGTTELDYADVARPFSARTYELPWPGEERESEEPLFGNYLFTNDRNTRLYPPQLPQMESPFEGQAAFSARVLGFYDAFATYPSFEIKYPNGQELGEEVTYRNPTGHHLTIGTRDRPGAAPFEVSTFTPGTVTPEGGYVPLGLYGPNTATHNGDTLPQSRHGLGVATQAPSAIVSFEGARQLTSQTDIISTIRVRVSGLEGLSNDVALTKINDTAQEIRRIDGLDATVVIGSTTQPVNIWIPLFAHGTDDPNGVQLVTELGWIQQDYGTLGVASWTASLTNTTVDRVTTASISLTSIFVLGLCLLARQERRTTHALLASQGWSTRQRLSWTLKEEWPGLAVFAVSSVIALLVANNSMIRYAVLIAIAVLILGLIIANPVRSRRLAPADRLGTRLRIIGLATAEGLSLGVTAIAIGAIGMMLEWYYRLVTQTSLGLAMVQAFIPVLSAILIAATIVIITTAVTNQKNRQATHARNDFSYWKLGRSQTRIRLIGLAPTLIHLTIAAGLVLLTRPYTSGLQDGDTLYLLLAGGWIFIWLIIRITTTLQWRPSLKLPSYQEDEAVGAEEPTSSSSS